MTFICTITADHPDKDSFVEYFAQAKIAGDVAIDGDRAETPFLFSPGRSRRDDEPYPEEWQVVLVDF